MWDGLKQAGQMAEMFMRKNGSWKAHFELYSQYQVFLCSVEQGIKKRNLNFKKFLLQSVKALESELPSHMLVGRHMLLTLGIIQQQNSITS